MKSMNLQLFGKRYGKVPVAEERAAELGRLMEFLIRRYGLESNAEPRHILEAMEAEGKRALDSAFAAKAAAEEPNAGQTLFGRSVAGRAGEEGFSDLQSASLTSDSVGSAAHAPTQGRGTTLVPDSLQRASASDSAGRTAHAPVSDSGAALASGAGEGAYSPSGEREELSSPFSDAMALAASMEGVVLKDPTDRSAFPQGTTLLGRDSRLAPEAPKTREGMTAKLNPGAQASSERLAESSSKAEAPEEELTLEARIARLEQNYAARIREEEKSRRLAGARKIYEKWKAQEQQTRELYPSFVLEKELSDPRFGELLRSGVDVRTAFEVIHKDEILSASMHYAACEVERRLSNKLMAASHRPSENGGVHAPSVSKLDLRHMSPKERKDIIRRVRMGEVIRF